MLCGNCVKADVCKRKDKCEEWEQILKTVRLEDELRLYVDCPSRKPRNIKDIDDMICQMR